MNAPVWVIHNPVSGRRRARRKAEALRTYLQQRSIPFCWRDTEGPGHARTLAQEARASGGELVIAAGGDGTISQVAGSLLDSEGRGPELLPWPMGSGNDFVANTGAACSGKHLERSFSDGESIRVDAIELQIQDPFHTPIYCFNNVGLGLEAEVIRQSHAIQHLRGLPLYLSAAWRSLRHAQAYAVTLCSDQQTVDVRLSMLAIANGSRTGGGFRILPNARVDDGLMDVALLAAGGNRMLLPLLGLVLLGLHVHSRRVQVSRVAELTLSCLEGIPVHADGDLIAESVRQMRCIMHPGVLRVRVPKSIGFRHVSV